MPDTIKPIAFRADASPQIGSGHIIRCLTLANGLRQQNNRCVFLCKALPDYLQNILQSAGHPIIHIPSSTERPSTAKNPLKHASWLEGSQEDDANACIRLIKQHDLHFQDIIVDHYAIDHRWQTHMRPYCERIGVIDDLYDRRHDTDWLIDQNAGHTAEHYASITPTQTQLFIGTDYALIRPEFAQQREAARTRRKQTQNIHHVVIFYTSNPSLELLKTTLRAFINIKTPLKVTCLTGQTHIHDKPLIDLVKMNQQHAIELKAYEPNMHTMLLEADLAIGAAGSSSWERCTLGLPALLTILAENQETLAQAQHQQGNAINLGHVSTLSENKISENIQRLMNHRPQWQSMSEAAFNLCDGNGIARITEALGLNNHS